MATRVHTPWINGMLDPSSLGVLSAIDWDTDDIEAALIDESDIGGASVTAALDAYDDISAGLVGTSTNLSGLSVSGGVVTSTGISFPNTTGDIADVLTVYKNSGTASTSPLAITWDSGGLPVTPNGGPITATFGSNVVITLA